MTIEQVSEKQARRIALVAQGFGGRAIASVGRRHVHAQADQLRLLQLDSVNVLERAHYFPLFSRLNSYDKTHIDDAAWTHTQKQPRRYVEYWAHEASLLPVEDWPLLRWRMDHYRDTPRWFREPRENVGLQREIKAALRDLGPSTAGQLGAALGHSHVGSSGWWELSAVKQTCEYLFAAGDLSTGTRRSFQRHYDLAERVLPEQVLGTTVSEPDAYRELLRKSVLAMGIGTEADLRDYYRLKGPLVKQSLSELVESGDAVEVEVPGWGEKAYLDPNAAGLTRRSKVSAAALICPFDPLIWFRPRTERIFGFLYRIEIYIPEPKRIYGYYVYPFLMDEELVGRVDLKADRAAGQLLVRGSFLEDGKPAAKVAERLADTLHELAQWQGLGEIVVSDKGNLAPALSAAI
jgi:uncharacterized protein YcaQ